MKRDSSNGESMGDFYRNDETLVSAKHHDSLNTLSIVIGVLSYLLLVLKSTFWTVMFAIFAFKTNLTECIAVQGIEQPINLLEQMSGSDPEIEAMIARTAGEQVDVTTRFQALCRFLFVQSALFQILVCCCCCSGRTQANRYDRMFLVFVVLVFSAVAVFVWALYERMRYVGQVCSGDFISESGLHGTPEDASEPQILLWEEMENDFYLISCGRLLKYFIVIESFFVFCCCCSSSIWVAITPNCFERFSTTVEYSQMQMQREIIKERIETKRRIRETDR